MPLRFSILALAAALCAAPAAAAAPDLAPVKKWIERQAKIKTLHATFKQERHLKTVKKPLESTGGIWFQAPGSIRWQSGDPPKVIAIIKAGGDLTIQHTDKKKAEVLTRKELEEKSDGMGVAFLESGFPRSLEEFQKRFEVTSVEKSGDYYQVEAKLAEGANPVLRKTVFFIHDGTWTLGGMHFYFRDGSRVESTFSGVEENKPIPASLFAPNLEGYSVK
jgi:outer membrane lipoprotein-sorting protein